ncbi:MAG: SPASM domain-containing protein [Candidatus Omnitrophica bacterium]|nr:SPASM domain-containing protein [Candidatus Omnitrophota bacterium]
MLRSINLSLSCACKADCIFCPSNRGQSIKKKLMPYALAKKIIDEVSSGDFKARHRINKIIIGENGDALLNKDTIPIMRYIRSTLPDIKIMLYTNFQHMTKDKSEAILKERLADLIRTNIDGSDAENYFAVKCIDYGAVSDNIRSLLALRKEAGAGIPLHISVLTLNNYAHTVHKNLGFLPAKLNNPALMNIEDDFGKVKERWETMLDSRIDRIYRCYSVIAWAERDKIDTGKIDYRKYSCTNLIRIKHEAFIAPDGTWYACCLDSDNELILGNLNKNTLHDIYCGEKRRDIIRLLEGRAFAKIGGPCKTVNCCQWLHKNRMVTSAYRVVFGNGPLVKLFYNRFYF